jgi:NAD(P)-dependent dehydrogenase (short-subunit alcohol dehydrogenase family)
VSPEAVTASRRLLAAVIDGVLGATVVGSFSMVGIAVRRCIGPWSEPPLLEGKLFVVTGASSGIGRAIAVGLARLGAHLVVVGRDDERLAATVRASVATRGGGRIASARVDLVDPEEVVSLAQRVGADGAHLDGVVHCAGALFADRRTAPDGVELTLALHVMAPFRLSQLLHPLLSAAPAPVIVTVSSGGMYTQRFDLDHLELGEDDYRGATAYARAKRAQVVLAHEWARRWGPDGVASYVMHPGWVATPGLATGLPSFARLGPLLRTPDQGADTAVWLTAGGAPRRAAPGEPALDTRGIWLDRRRRSEFYLPTTYRRPANQRRDGAALWEWCAARAAVPTRP